MDSSTFNRRHPDADTRATLYSFLIDAWDGTGGFMPPLDDLLDQTALGLDANNFGTVQDQLPDWKLTSYIDRFPRESLDKWRARVRRAHYTNVTRTVGETLVGFLCRRMPTRTGGDEVVERFLADADGQGTPWDELLQTCIAPRLWLFGSLPILVDRPAGRAESAADAGATYATILYPQSLYDWETDEAGQPLWAKFVDTLSECESAEAERKVYYRATEWTRTGWRRWRMEAGGDPMGDGEPGTHPCGEVPVVLGSMTPPISPTILGTSLAHEVATEGRKLFNYQSLLDEHLYNQVFAVLAVVMPKQGRQDGFKLGTDNALFLPFEGSSANYIAPPQSVADTLFNAIESCIRRIYRAARLEFTLKDSGQAESGTARQYEFAATNRALSSFAHEMERIERETLRLVCLWEGRDPDAVLADYSCAWPDDFDVRDLEREMKLALDTMILPIGETARKALVRTVRDDVISLTDEEREQSDREIDEGEVVVEMPDADVGSEPPADSEDSRKKCAARTQEGNACDNWAVAGSRYCRMHGGVPNEPPPPPPPPQGEEAQAPVPA